MIFAINFYFRYLSYALETGVGEATIISMHFIRSIITSLFLVQLSYSDDPNWRVLRVIEQTQPFNSLNSIYRKEAVKKFWSENAKIMEEITENWDVLLKSSKTPGLVPVNFAEHAKSMGAESEHVQSISELEDAFKRAKKSKKTYVISIHTDGYQWLEGSAYWESPTLSIPSTEGNKKSLKEHLEGKKKQRKGV